MTRPESPLAINQNQAIAAFYYYKGVLGSQAIPSEFVPA